VRNGIASILICTLLVSACATAPGPHGTTPAKPASIKEWMAMQSRAKRNAIAGAIVGGLLGFANARITGVPSDDVWRHVAAGAAAGAIAGFAAGRRQDRIFAGRDLAVREARYDRSQGYVARVEEVAFQPANPRPGQPVKLYVRYMVLGPDPNEALTIRMFRGLKYGEDYVFGVGPNEFVVPRGGGIVESTMDLTLPKKAPEGTYSIEALLEDAQGRFPQVVGTNAVYIVAQSAQRAGVVTAAR
jgi:hypothetical protein